MRIQLVPYETSNEIEAEEIHSIINQYYENSPWPATLIQIKSGNVKYFRALYEGEQVGMSGYILRTPTLAETVKTTIFKEHQGKKLGAQVSLAIEEECKRVGVKKVMTTIYYFNHSMINIKLKQGYQIEGYHPDHEAPGFHEYSLGKRL